MGLLGFLYRLSGTALNVLPQQLRLDSPPSLLVTQRDVYFLMVQSRSMGGQLQN